MVWAAASRIAQFDPACSATSSGLGVFSRSRKNSSSVSSRAFFSSKACMRASNVADQSLPANEMAGSYKTTLLMFAVRSEASSAQSPPKE